MYYDLIETWYEVHTVNSLYIELGYNEIPTYIEVNIFAYNLQTVNITTSITKFG